MNAHRSEVDPGFLTTHKLSLDGLTENNVSLIAQEINGLSYIDNFQLNLEKTSLNISYDASQRNIDEVISILEKHGASLKLGWWSHRKLSWQRQIDENIKANSKHVAHCCNKTPRR